MKKTVYLICRKQGDKTVWQSCADTIAEAEKLMQGHFVNNSKRGKIFYAIIEGQEDSNLPGLVATRLDKDSYYKKYTKNELAVL